MDDKDLEKQLEEFTKNSEVYNHILKENIEYAKKNNLSIKDAKEATLRSIKAIDDASKMYKRSTKDIGDNLKKLEESFKNQEITAEDLEEQLGRLRNEVNRSTDQSAKQRLIAQKSYLEEQVVRKKFVDSMETAFGQQFGAVVGGLTNAITSAGKSALGGGSGFQVAGELMTAGVDIVNKSVQAGAKGITDVGGAMMNMGGRYKIAGGLLTGFGVVVGGASAALSELAKSGIQFMIRETQKTIETFRTVSQSGALFSDGMLGMRRSAETAGMSLEDFSKVASTNKEAFAKLGMGVSGGMKRMSGAMEAGGEGMRKQLFGLGYSMEDQGNMIARVMSDMAGPSGRLKASNEEVATRTQAYAKNLALLSALTGEDMKAKEEQIRKENDNLAMEQLLSEMGEVERSKFLEAQKGMSEMNRRAMNEMLLHGAVVSTDINIAQAMSSSLQQQNEENVRAAREHRLSVESVAATNAKYAEQGNKEVMANKEFARAMTLSGGEGAKAAQMMMETNRNNLKFQGKSVEEQKKILDEQAKNAKKDPMVEAQEKANQFGIEMSRLATNNLPLFSTALNESMALAKQGVQGFKDFVEGIKKDPTWVEKIIAGIGALTGAIPGLITAIQLIKMAIDWFKGKNGGGADIDLPDGKGKGGPPKGPQPGGKGNIFKRGFDAVKGGASSLIGKINPVNVMAGATAAAGGLLLQSGLEAASDKLLEKTGKDATPISKEMEERDKANWDKASLWEKTQSALPRGIESAGSFFGFEGLSNAAKRDRIANESKYMDEKSKAAVGVTTSQQPGYTSSTPGPANLPANLPASSTQVQAVTNQVSEVSKETAAMKDSLSKLSNQDLISVLKSQLDKQDQMILVLKESLDVNQRMLNHAYS